MKKRSLLIASILLLACISLTLIACDNSTQESPVGLEIALTASLSDYLNSDGFRDAMTSKTTQDRLPLAYLRYVDTTNIETIQDGGVVMSSLNLISSVINSDGKIDDALYLDENCPLYETVTSDWGSYTDGWQSISDFLFSWSIMYNQYKQYCINLQSNAHDNLFGKYFDAIQTYLASKDSETYIATAFSFDKNSILTLTAHNLGLDAKSIVPQSYNALLAYYAKDKNGNFTTASGYSNWTGFTGRPLASGSILKNESAYDVAYEKTMQGLFPYQDNFDTNIAIEDTVNLDRLCDNYGYVIPSEWGSTADSRFGILYGYLNGIDMSAYTKEVHDEDEQADKAYDVIGMWLATLNKDDNGNYVLQDQVDMAVAIAYLAYQKSVSASPCGLYTASDSIIKLA